MNTTTKILLAGAAALGIFYFWNKKKEDEEEPAAPSTGPGDKPVPDPDPARSPGIVFDDPPARTAPIVDGRVGDVAGLIKVGFGDLIGRVPIDAPSPPQPTPDPPGFSPGSAVPSFSVTPGFEGYIQIEKNDTLGKLAVRLGLGYAAWRKIRDLGENGWLKALCPVGCSCSTTYYGGESGIPLFARYGKTPGSDCSVPGWGPTYSNVYHSSNTGQYPIVAWFPLEG